MADTLKDAYLLFKKRKYSDVIKILEPQVFRFRENFNFYYILGMSCLYQGDYGGAFSYLRRAFDLREEDINTLLGIAVIYLKRGDTGNALRIWLDVVDLDPDNPYAAKGLNYLRKNTDADDFTGISAQDKIVKFLPQPGAGKRFNLLPLIIPVVIAAAFIFPLSREFIVDTVSSINLFSGKKEVSRPEIPEITLDSRKDYVDLNGSYSYILTEKEVEQKLKDIQDYLYEFRDNIAQREINMILLSNASEYVKERARLLSRYVSEPKLTNFHDNFGYAEVTSSPLLYENCWVLWKGKATNLAANPEKISFDFLVGYHEEKTLDGIVPATFDFTIKIIPDQPIELLGQLKVDSNGKLSLKGSAVHRLQ